MSEKALNQDTLKILRSVIKISSSLVNLDELHGSKYLKFKFKVASREWSKMMEIHTSETMKALTEENSELLIDVYQHFEDCCKDVFIKDADKTNLLLFYAKIKSALNDLDKLDNKASMFSVFITYTCKKLLAVMDKQFNQILSIQDEQGRGINYLVDFYDDFAEKIMSYTEEEKNELGGLDNKKKVGRKKSSKDKL